MSGELFVGGTWVDGRGVPFAAIDPAYQETVWRGAGASPGQVGDALGAARAAFPAWARTSLEARIAIARAFASRVQARGEALAEAISREMGKPLWESRGEVASVIAKIEISIRAQDQRAGFRQEAAPFGGVSLAHRPHGVMAVLGPFNFPAHLPNGHIAPALLAGDCVVFKPSEKTPSAAALMTAAWEEAGLPAGVLNLVQGGHETGGALLAGDIDGVLFTGSPAVGRLIHAQFAGRPDLLLALEMGGNNPLIVWPPVDANAAANLVVHSAWATTGQRCSCARRLIVPEGKFGDQLIERLVALGAGLSVSGWKDRPDAFMGPLVGADAGAHAARFVERLTKLGAIVIAPADRRAAFVRPALVDMSGISDPPDEELFAPLLQVYRVRDIDMAFARAGATRYRLAGGLICDDPDIWGRAQLEMHTGVLNWNRPTTGASSAMPFGGPGLSGNLRPGAAYAADYCAYPVASQTAPKALAIPAQGLPA